MRKLITGVDADGRSCLLEAAELELASPVPGVAMGTVYETTDATPPGRPPSDRDLLPMGLEPGRVRWLVMQWTPEMTMEIPIHHTDTVDLNFIVSGSCQLVLDDGLHEVVPGDLVVCTGVDHSWKNGPDGCVMSSLQVGTPPLD